MTSSDRLVIVSADSHCGAKPETYRPYIEKKYWPALNELVTEDEQYSNLPYWDEPDEEALAIIDPRGTIMRGGRTGAWDLARRLRELDADGVAAEVIGQGHQLAVSLWFGQEAINAHPAELRAVGAKAHHRWVADMIAESGGRLRGLADPGPCLDMAAEVEELRWVAERGFVQISLPGILSEPALPPLTDEYFDPFWATCEETGLVLNIHAGHGGEQGHFFDTKDASKRKNEGQANPETSNTDMMAKGGVQKRVRSMYRPARYFWQLVLGGVFDRHPELKLTLTEMRSYWIKDVLDFLDQRVGREHTHLKMTPTEYFMTHCFVTPSNIRRSEVERRDELGVERLMFGSDYPHPESTWPNTADWIRATFKGVPVAEARRILGENAAELFGFDRSLLQTVADRIGPRVDDVLGDSGEVDPRLIETFDVRSGFNKPLDTPLEGWGFGELIDADLATISNH